MTINKANSVGNDRQPGEIFLSYILVIREHLTNIINTIISGKLPPGAATFLRGINLNALAKEEGSDDIRPIGLQVLYRKLAGSVINSSDDISLDDTEHTRKIKHSEFMRDDIRKLELLKLKHPEMMKTAPLKFREMASSEAFFLFSNYTDIFNKLLKNELDLDIMVQV